jgi:hypothetical protein
MNGLDCDAPAYRDSYSPEFNPLHGTWYFRINSSGEILEVDVIVVRTEDWDERSEAKDAHWRPIDFGGLVVAVKALC